MGVSAEFFQGHRLVQGNNLPCAEGTPAGTAHLPQFLRYGQPSIWLQQLLSYRMGALWRSNRHRRSRHLVPDQG